MDYKKRSLHERILNKKNNIKSSQDSIENNNNVDFSNSCEKKIEVISEQNKFNLGTTLALIAVVLALITIILAYRGLELAKDIPTKISEKERKNALYEKSLKAYIDFKSQFELFSNNYQFLLKYQQQTYEELVKEMKKMKLDSFNYKYTEGAYKEIKFNKDNNVTIADLANFSIKFNEDMNITKLHTFDLSFLDKHKTKIINRVCFINTLIKDMKKELSALEKRRNEYYSLIQVIVYANDIKKMNILKKVVGHINSNFRIIKQGFIDYASKECISKLDSYNEFRYFNKPNQKQIKESIVNIRKFILGHHLFIDCIVDGNEKSCKLIETIKNSHLVNKKETLR